MGYGHQRSAYRQANEGVPSRCSSSPLARSLDSRGLRSAPNVSALALRVELGLDWQPSISWSIVLSGMSVRSLPSNKPLQPPHSAVTRLACATRAPAGGRLNGGVRRRDNGEGCVQR